MLQAGLTDGLDAKKGRQHGNGAIQDRHRGRAHPPTGALQVLAQFFIDHGIEHRAGQHADGLDHRVELGRGFDQGPDVQLNLDIFELGQAGSGDGIDGLASGIGDQVHVKG